MPFLVNLSDMVIWPTFFPYFRCSWVIGPLHVWIPQPPTIFCDNIDITQLCSNLVFHSCIKHVTIDFHSICDKVQNGALVSLMCCEKINYWMLWQNRNIVSAFFLSRLRLKSSIEASSWEGMLVKVNVYP